MTEIEKDKLMNTTIFKIHRLILLTDKIADHQLQSLYGLSLSQFLIMYMFKLLPKANQRLAAEALNLSGAAVSKQIEKLQTQGWLEKSSKQTDRRQHHWQITAKGQKIFNQAYNKIDELSQDTRSLLTLEELEVFKIALDKILQKAIEDYKSEFKVSC